MIIDILLWILSGFAYIVVAILKVIPFAIPDSWEVAITQMFSYFGYFQGWLPMYPDATKTGLWAITGLMPLIGTFITAIIAVYIVKGVIMLLHLFSFGNIHLKVPSFKGRGNE